MVQTILEMRVEKYEQELRMKDVQLKYIHMQLKPHYFLNALSTINSMVYQHEEENVHTFIQHFHRISAICFEPVCIPFRCRMK